MAYLIKSLLYVDVILDQRDEDARLSLFIRAGWHTTVNQCLKAQM